MFLNKYLLIATFVGVLASGGVGYYKGYKQGKDKQIATQQAQVFEAVKQALTKQKQALESEYQAGFEAEKNNKKIEIVYKDKIIKVKEIIKVSEVLNNPICTLPKNEIDSINELLKVEIK